ncbi:ABC transporter B family member 11 [Hibiscus syriacus]|uniref:ABC transporter B family member 11 n=1 Tax=Hibiscus syriacus TaxID=106335 RepID=A0A6A2X8B8_HIBSY|nr:ABC transporter B family member 11 [Hibiscus syriacus]
MVDTKDPFEQPLKQHPEVSIHRLACLNKPEIPMILLGTIAASANGVILPTFGMLLSRVINTFFKPPDELRRDSRFWSLILMTLGLASLLACPAQTYFFSIAGCKLIQRIRSMCFEKVIRMEVGWFDDPDNSSGSIGARLSTDATLIRGLVGDALAQMVSNLASAISGLVIAFIASWKLTFIILGLLPLIGVNGYVQVKFMKGFSADAKVKYEEASQVANDAVGSIRQWLHFVQRKNFYVGSQLVEHGDATFSDVIQTVALVGESGSGKSTVISLLQRFYDPDLGHITLDGFEIQTLQLKWLRQQMGLVSQEPVLFNDTIRANIAYGRGGNAAEAEILTASELANAHKDTVVGERGVQLSGGQKQRVAIALAIVKTPKILLLDEAVSALDAKSERVVQDALDSHGEPDDSDAPNSGFRIDQLDDDEPTEKIVRTYQYLKFDLGQYPDFDLGQYSDFDDFSEEETDPACNDFDIGQYPNFDDETAVAEEDVVDDN